MTRQIPSKFACLVSLPMHTGLQLLLLLLPVDPVVRDRHQSIQDAEDSSGIANTADVAVKFLFMVGGNAVHEAGDDRSSQRLMLPPLLQPLRDGRKEGGEKDKGASSRGALGTCGCSNVNTTVLSLRLRKDVTPPNGQQESTEPFDLPARAGRRYPQGLLKENTTALREYLQSREERGNR